MNKPQMALSAATAFLLLLAYGSPFLLKILPKTFSLILKFIRSLLRIKTPDEIVLGEILLNDEDRKRHTHIVGATGLGKTVLMEALICEDIRRGRGALIIDAKGDRELFERIKKYCQDIGREKDLHLLSAEHKNESVRWNPCRLGSPAEIQSKLLNICVFTEAYYQKACESVLQEVVNKTVGLPHLHLPSIVSALDNTKTKNEIIAGLFFDFNNLINSEWGEILCASPVTDTLSEINLLDITRKNEILFVDLPTEAKSVQSGKIGRLLLQEFKLISGLRKIYPHLRSPIPFSIFVDEFDVFATEDFATFQNKARSSNFMIHLAHQTLSDLRSVSENFTGKILGNTNVRFVFRQDDPVDAENWAALFGTKRVIKQTFKTSAGDETGDASNRESKEYRIHPDEIKELGIGECIFSAKSSKTLKKVRVPFKPPHVPKQPKIKPAHDFKHELKGNHAEMKRKK